VKAHGRSLAALVLLGSVAGAQDAPAPAPSAPAQEYFVGPGDILQVTVFGNEDLSRAPTVQTNGTIGLPLVGPATSS
jgi:polysaccharide export outer membrane protein